MTSSLRSTARKKTGALLAVSALLMVVQGGAAKAEGSDLGGFSALAVASGQRVTLTVTQFLVIQEFFDGAGPVAQSTMDPQSGGESFGSFPYPGSTALQYPAFVALGTGTTPPGYPFYVKADTNEGEKSLADPTETYRLHAKADREMAESLARLRGSAGDAGQAGSVSTTSIKQEGGKLVATAESLTDGQAIGPLRIASVHSKSVTTFVPGESAPKTTTEMRLDGGAVGDQRFSFGPKGLTVTETAVPVPVSEGLAALNDALKPSGLSVRFLDPEPITGGAQAGTFEVTATRDIAGSGAGVLRTRFGQATSAIVPGGDYLSSLPPVESSAGPEPSPIQATSPDPGDDRSSGSGIVSDASPSGPGLLGVDLGLGATGGSASDASSGSTFAGAAGAVSAPAQSGDNFVASAPEVDVASSAGGTPSAVGARRLAATAIPRAVDGIYSAVAWATIGVLAFSLIWRQGARKWTS
jgi:hypothetical protein